MTVQAQIRIHVMGVSETAGVQMTEGGNKWLERRRGEHNSQLGLAGNDEASGTNLPCTLTHTQECKSVFCLVSLLLCCPPLWQSPVFAFHPSSGALCVWWSAHNTLLPSRILSSTYSVSLPRNAEFWAREGEMSATFFFWSLVFLIILSAFELLVSSTTTCQNSIHLCNKDKSLHRCRAFFT